MLDECERIANPIFQYLSEANTQSPNLEQQNEACAENCKDIEGQRERILRAAASAEKRLDASNVSHPAH